MTSKEDVAQTVSEMVEDRSNNDEADTTRQEEQQTLCTSWHEKSYRTKFFYSLYITLAFGALGLCWGQRGPAFLDLQIVTNVDLKQGSAFFTAGSIGYLLGSMVSGMLYDKFNKTLLMFSVTFGMGLFTGVLPFCSPYILMVAMHLVTGIFMGGLDTCGNAELVRNWGANGRSAMQTGHFSFAFAGVISPLFTKPFISPLLKSTSNNTLEDGNVTNLTFVGEGYNVTTENPVVQEKQTTIIFYAFLITAVLSMIISIPFLVIHFKERAKTKKRTPGQEEVAANREFSIPVFIVTLVMICIMYMLYCCVEDSFSAFLMTFVVKGQGWSKSDGTIVTAVFWAFFSFGRFCGIFFVKFVSSVKLIMMCGITLVIFQTGFLVSALYHFNTGIWLCTAGSGLAMAVFFPTGLTWTEDELVKMSGRVSSAILISASSGTMINPIMLGYLMESLTPMWYSFLLVGESILTLLVFLVLLIFARTYLKKRRRIVEITKTIEVNGTPTTNVDQKFI